MKTKTPTYDSRCFDLAEVFLSDEPTLKGREHDLAVVIQETIEDWIADEKKPPFDPDEDKYD